MKYNHGVISCGHEVTADAAVQVLENGGNAFDAIVAAHFAACVAEPVLASLGGGGFLLAQTVGGNTQVYDFFAQTPLYPRSTKDIEFFPIHADFGTTRQEFHIGAGSVAVPGAVKGMYAIHKELCTMPMKDLLSPAIEAARCGVIVNPFQSYLLDVVKPIYQYTSEARGVFSSKTVSGKLLQPEEKLQQLDLANTFEVLAREGEDLFYRGEIAQQIIAFSHEWGGQIDAADLQQYQAKERAPIKISYRGNQIYTNPTPSSGGVLIALALKLLEDSDISNYPRSGAKMLKLLTEVMSHCNLARTDQSHDVAGLLDPDLVAEYRAKVANKLPCHRGTTHMTVMDAKGNVASLTVSNGEGCGRFLGDTGVMLNNMLGEEDLNPQGYDKWPQGERLSSMMAPTLVVKENGEHIALGSGGSNRIRSAIFQTLVNLLDFDMSLSEALLFPRLHYERDMLSIENGFDSSELRAVRDRYPQHQIWPDRNMFFGGVHAASCRDQLLTGAADPRRGGVTVTV